MVTPLPRDWQPRSNDLAPEGINTAAVIRDAPAWLISLVVHMVLLLVLGLWLLPQVKSRVFELALSYSDSLGEQLEEDAARFAAEPDEATEQLITPDNLQPVEQPLASSPPLETVVSGLVSSTELQAPTLGIALSGREAGMKQALLAAYGGTALTEAAVAHGLEWLKRNQRRNGTWSLTGPYTDGAHNENPTAATAMALIAFQGAGHTHRTGNYREVVAKGSKALIQMQKRDGDFFRGTVSHHRLYSQAQAMIAICELYGMTKDSNLRLPAELAVEYAVNTQDRLGGWRYEPGYDSDTSVTGWFVMGLQSARMAGLQVPSGTLHQVSSYLDRAAVANGARYGYQPGMESTPPMTAEALLCRQYLGWKRDDPRLQAGVKLIAAYPIDWENRDVYYWYYATQVLHHLEGAEWDSWNDTMRTQLPEHQTQTGPEKGSWAPSGDRWGPHGGRLYVTCLSLYMLEVYYRHLPIYASATTGP